MVDQLIYNSIKQDIMFILRLHPMTKYSTETIHEYHDNVKWCIFFTYMYFVYKCKYIYIIVVQL